MILDCHCHAGKGDGLTGPWDTSAPLEPYFRRARRAGIAVTVLFATFHSDYQVANAEVARLVAAHPGRALGFAFVHPVADKGRVVQTVGEAVRRHGFCGIKVHRRDGTLTREICEAARRYRLPVLYDPMGEAALIDLVAPEYPEVDFIVPHLGSFADDWKAQRTVIDLMVRHANVHADTAGVRRFDLLVEAVERAGARKLLFGSDGPWLHPGLELAKIRALRLPPSEEALVTGGNLLRLLGRRSARVTPAAPAASATLGR